MIRFAICDDDHAMTGTIESLLLSLSSQYSEDFEVDVFFSGEDLCEHINATGKSYDIILLDIEMQGITGVDAGKLLRENVSHSQTLLIFISSHKKYHQEIIDLNVFCFIPKPIHHGEFFVKLKKAIEHVISVRQLSRHINHVITQQGQDIFIPIDTIVFLESDVRQIIIHTTTGAYTYYGKLSVEEAKFPKNVLCRIHKSYLVNFSHMESIKTNELFMKGGRRLPISEKYRESVKIAYAIFRGRP